MRKTDDRPTFRFFYGFTDENLVLPWRTDVRVLVHSSVHGVRFVKKCNEIYRVNDLKKYS